MGPRWWRSPWMLLGIVVLVPLLVFGVPALLPHSPIPPPPTPTPTASRAPNLAQACPSPPAPASAGSPAPSPTLAPPLPPARVGETFFYDAADNDVVMVGGSDFSSEQPFDDAWTLDARGWQQGADPSWVPGWVVEDPQSSGLISLGVSPAGGAAATWRWDGQAWAPLAPSPLAAGCTVVGLEPFGADLVLVAENLQDTYETPPSRTVTWSGSSWSLDHPATNLPVGSAPPLISADPAHHRIVALVSATQLGPTQTWAWQGSTWQLVNSTYQLSLDPISATMASDPQGGSVLLYMNPPGRSACTWALSGSTWHEVDAASPDDFTEYQGSVLLTDSRVGRVILVGGPAQPGGNGLDTLWIFSGSSWTAEPASALTG